MWILIIYVNYNLLILISLINLNYLLLHLIIIYFLYYKFMKNDQFNIKINFKQLLQLFIMI
jgi:hypothetical protein